MDKPTTGELFPDAKPRKRKTNAVQRSLKELRDLGWAACVVEKWIPPRGEMKFGVRLDAFGFGDILACNPVTKQIALVQCCSDSGGQAGMPAHKAKILGCVDYYTWRKSGGLVLLHGWKLRGSKGKKRWLLNQESIEEVF